MERCDVCLCVCVCEEGREKDIQILPKSRKELYIIIQPKINWRGKRLLLSDIHGCVGGRIHKGVT